jgi:hypothetical protein
MDGAVSANTPPTNSVILLTPHTLPLTFGNQKILPIFAALNF